MSKKAHEWDVIENKNKHWPTTYNNSAATHAVYLAIFSKMRSAKERSRWISGWILIFMVIWQDRGDKLWEGKDGGMDLISPIKRHLYPSKI